MKGVKFLSQDWQEIVKLYEKDNVNLGNEIIINECRDLQQLDVRQMYYICISYTDFVVCNSDSFLVHSVCSDYKLTLKHQSLKYSKWRIITEFYAQIPVRAEL